jgi:hypothetical protein
MFTVINGYKKLKEELLGLRKEVLKHGDFEGDLLLRV